MFLILQINWGAESQIWEQNPRWLITTHNLGIFNYLSPLPLLALKHLFYFQTLFSSQILCVDLMYIRDEGWAAPVKVMRVLGPYQSLSTQVDLRHLSRALGHHKPKTESTQMERSGSQSLTKHTRPSPWPPCLPWQPQFLSHSTL